MEFEKTDNPEQHYTESGENYDNSDDTGYGTLQDEGFEDEASGATEQTEVNGPAGGKRFYTNEEMRGLDFTSVDTSRIPPEHLPFYKSMQASFTRTKQKEHSRLKEAAGTAGATPITAAGLTFDEFRQAQEHAQRMIAEQYARAGKDADPFDPAYQLGVTQTAGRIAQEMQAGKHMQTTHRNELVKAQAKYGPQFAQIDSMANHILHTEYSAEVAQHIILSAAGGNYGPMYIMLDEARKRLSGNAAPAPSARPAGHLPQNEGGFVGMTEGGTRPQPVKQQTRRNPPTTEGAGGQSKGRFKDETERLFGF